MPKLKEKQNDSLMLMANLLSVVTVIFGLWQLKQVLVPLIFSAIFSFLLLPICIWFERLRFPRVLAIIFAILFAFTLVFVFFYLFIGQIRSLDEVWPVMIETGERWLNATQNFISVQLGMGESQQLLEAQKYLADLLKNSGRFISNMLSSTTGFLANLSLIPLYVFLMLLYRDFFLEFLYRLFKKLSKPRINLVLGKIKSVVQSYMSGLILVILIVGTLNTLALLFLGIPHAFFFGYFAAVLVLIPYIGIAIGSLLPIMMALITKDSAWYAVGVAACFGFIQFLEGNFITPYIVGSKVSINSFVAIVSLLLFGSLWGVAGLVLALPLTAITKVIFDSTETLKPWGFLLGESDIQNKKK